MVPNQTIVSDLQTEVIRDLIKTHTDYEIKRLDPENKGLTLQDALEAASDGKVTPNCDLERLSETCVHEKSKTIFVRSELDLIDRAFEKEALETFGLTNTDAMSFSARKVTDTSKIDYLVREADIDVEKCGYVGNLLKTNLEHDGKPIAVNVYKGFPDVMSGQTKVYLVEAEPLTPEFRQAVKEEVAARAAQSRVAQAHIAKARKSRTP